MRRAITCFAALLIITTFAVISLAAEVEEVYITGKVVAYKTGASIAVTDTDDEKHNFSINEDTEVVGKPAVGTMVELEARGTVAVYIEAIEEMDEEDVKYDD